MWCLECVFFVSRCRLFWFLWVSGVLGLDFMECVVFGLRKEEEECGEFWMWRFFVEDILEWGRIFDIFIICVFRLLGILLVIDRFIVCCIGGFDWLILLGLGGFLCIIFILFFIILVLFVDDLEFWIIWGEYLVFINLFVLEIFDILMLCDDIFSLFVGFCMGSSKGGGGVGLLVFCRFFFFFGFIVFFFECRFIVFWILSRLEDLI